MDKFSFFDLRVYAEAKRLVVDVYQLMRKFPVEERFALCDQLRRSVTSIPSNNAEPTSERMQNQIYLSFAERGGGRRKSGFR